MMIGNVSTVTPAAGFVLILDAAGVPVLKARIVYFSQNLSGGISYLTLQRKKWTGASDYHFLLPVHLFEHGAKNNRGESFYQFSTERKLMHFVKNKMSELISLRKEDASWDYSKRWEANQGDPSQSGQLDNVYTFKTRAKKEKGNADDAPF